MVESTKRQPEGDWEMTEDFYCEEEGKASLSLEDFIEEEGLPAHAPKKENAKEISKMVEAVAQDVKAVMDLASHGMNIAGISKETGLDEQYVYNIQVCAQGFREDDEMAVAHLVMMG